MSVKRRLQYLVEARRVQEVCWRCALRRSRHISTTAFGIDEGPDGWEATAGFQTEDVYPGLSEFGETQIRKNHLTQANNSSQCIEPRSRKDVDTTILPQRNTKSRNETFHDDLRASDCDSRAAHWAKQGAHSRNKTSQIDSSLFHRNLLPTPKECRSLSFDNDPSNKNRRLYVGCEEQSSDVGEERSLQGCEPLLRTRRNPSLPTRHSGPQWDKNAEYGRLQPTFQTHRSVCGDGPRVIGENWPDSNNDSIASLRSESRRRKADTSTRSISGGNDTYGVGSLNVRLDAIFAQHLTRRRTRLDPAIKQVSGLTSRRNLSDWPVKTALTIKQSKTRERASYQQHLRFSTSFTKKDSSTSKHITRDKPLSLVKIEGNYSSYMRRFSRRGETSLSGKVHLQQNTTEAQVTENSNNMAGHDLLTNWQQITAESVRNGMKPGVYVQRGQRDSLCPAGHLSRRKAEEESSQGNPENPLDERDEVPGIPRQVPKRRAAGYTRFTQARSRILPPSYPDQSHLRPKTVTSFEIAAEASRMTTLHQCHIRFASTLANRYPETNHNFPLAVNSSHQSGNQTAGQPIREHLKAWRPMQGNEARPERANYIGSQNWADGTLNTLTQSAGGGEILAELGYEEILDIERKLNASSEDIILDIINPHIHLRRGDLLELEAAKGSILGIFTNETNGSLEIYTERGSWRQVSPPTIRFSIPGVVRSSALSGLMEYLPSCMTHLGMTDESASVSNVPRDIGSHLIEVMVNFNRASDAVYREHADRFNRAYEILSQGRCKDQLSVSLEDAAMQILQKQSIADLSPPMLLAVHRVLCQHPYMLREGKFHRMVPRFKILRPTTLVKANNVRDWSRLYQNNMVNETMKSPFDEVNTSVEVSADPIAAFAAKAHRIVSFNRQNRPLSPVGSVGSSFTKVILDDQTSTTWKASEENQEPFNSHDQQIISFLDIWAASNQLNKTSNLHSLGPAIVRATGLYENLEVGRPTAFTLLKELGIIKPWDRYTLFENKLGLPGHDPNHPATILRDQACESLSRLSLPLHDSMARFRKAWGNQTVFCIDSKNTLSRDDGISLERVKGDPSLCWVHVHVANPSAFLSKDSPVALFARHATASVYFPEHVYPMMDAEWSQKHFSLANGRPCITFSAKISAEGDVLEKEISHGILNDVRHLSLEQVMQAVAPSVYKAPEEDQEPFLRVGQEHCFSGSPKASPTQPETTNGLDESDVETLRSLQRISKALGQRRRRAGAVSSGHFASGQTSLTVYISAPESSVATVQNHQSLCIIGDPMISINPVLRVVGEIHAMVMEFMLLAGQTCGLWCSERNIPIPYRGIVRKPDAKPFPKTYREAVLDPPIASQGHADLRLLYEYLGLIGKAFVSASPLEHATLGLPMYCKVTSPLRRYGDLFAHWQIEAALRHEHSTGTSLVGSHPATYEGTGVLPFSHQEVDAAARRVWDEEQKISKASAAASEHWKTEAIYRAFYFHEAPLPALFEFVVTMLPGNGFPRTSGILTAWGKHVKINMNEVSEGEGGYRVDDVWEGKIVQVIHYLGSVIVDPVRLVRRKPDHER